MAKPSPTVRGRPTCVLALQGGGALGAYHIGAYQALAEHGFEPDWFSGISIGAINSAVLAGTPPAERVARLEELWRLISWPEVFQPLRLLPLEILYNTMSNAEALVMGQPHFFRPRPLNPLFAPAGPPTLASFYDTTPMIETLRRLVDFDLINAGPVRLTLGATDVETGQVVFFDSANRRKPIGPAHVLASGSLPPGFAATEIDGRFYWDGGCVSNTPAEAVLEDQPKGHTLLFLIDLWNAAGPPPTTMSEVLWRAKQIQYASRGHLLAEHLAAKANLRHAAAAVAAASRDGKEQNSTTPPAPPTPTRSRMARAGSTSSTSFTSPAGTRSRTATPSSPVPRSRSGARRDITTWERCWRSSPGTRPQPLRRRRPTAAARCCIGCGKARSKPTPRLNCPPPRLA